MTHGRHADGKKAVACANRSPVRDQPLYSPNPDGLKNSSLCVHAVVIVIEVTVGGIAAFVFLPTIEPGERSHDQAPGPARSGRNRNRPCAGGSLFSAMTHPDGLCVRW